MTSHQAGWIIIANKGAHFSLLVVAVIVVVVDVDIDVAGIILDFAFPLCACPAEPLATTSLSL